MNPQQPSNTKENLTAKNLGKNYGDRQVVQGVSFFVSRGETVGLLGPNGAGKTTSFYMMVGLVAPVSGGVFLAEQDITQLPIHKRAELGIGYLPQNVSIFRKMTVEANLLGVMEVVGVPRRDRYALLEELIEKFQLTRVKKSLGITLSGGERRRVEIARALISKPRFLLLDEPFAGVDPVTVQEIQNIINELKKSGLGVLITDHNVRETLGICDRAYILSQGKIIAEGAPDVVSNLPVVREVYLGDRFSL